MGPGHALGPTTTFDRKEVPVGIVYPTMNGRVRWSAGTTTLRTDQPWHASSVLVRERPDLFGATPGFVYGADTAVEQATAAPGEKRTTRRKTKKAGAGDASEGEE